MNSVLNTFADSNLLVHSTQEEISKLNNTDVHFISPRDDQDKIDLVNRIRE